MRAPKLHSRRHHIVRGLKKGDVEGATGIMATTTKTKVAAKTSRYNELKKMLEERRRELLNAVQGKMRDVRAEGSKERDVLDQGESSEVDIQEDIEFALIQMKSETLNKVDAALRRLEDGSYGDCFECGEEIAEARLRALPFAVRCKDCEEARETAERRERVQAQKRGSSALFYDMQN
jgi:DnaK suppressor protein